MAAAVGLPHATATRKDSVSGSVLLDQFHALVEQRRQQTGGGGKSSKGGDSADNSAHDIPRTSFRSPGGGGADGASGRSPSFRSPPARQYSIGSGTAALTLAQVKAGASAATVETATVEVSLVDPASGGKAAGRRLSRRVCRSPFSQGARGRNGWWAA